MDIDWVHDDKTGLHRFPSPICQNHLNELTELDLVPALKSLFCGVIVPLSLLLSQKIPRFPIFLSRLGGSLKIAYSGSMSAHFPNSS